MKIVIFLSVFLQLVTSFGQHQDVISKSHAEAKRYWGESSESKNKTFRYTQIDMHVLSELNLRAANYWERMMKCKQGNTAEAVVAFAKQAAECPEVQKYIFDLHKNIYESLVSADLVPILERYSEDNYLKVGHLPMHPLLFQILVNFYAAVAAAERLSESIYEQVDLERLMKFDIEATLRKIAEAKAETDRKRFLELTDYADKLGPQFGRKLFGETKKVHKNYEIESDKRMQEYKTVRARTDQLFEYQVNFISNILFLIRQATVFKEDCVNFGLIPEYSINAIYQSSLARQIFEGSIIKNQIQNHIRATCLSKFKLEAWSRKPEIVPPSLKVLTYINRNYFLSAEK